jgi:Spy/CpxP family protein refolding chaperone
MKNFRTIAVLMAVIFTLFAVSFAFAQSAPPAQKTPAAKTSPAVKAPATPPTAPAAGPKGKHHNERLEQLSKELGLTDAQKNEIKTVWQQTAEKIKAVRNDSTLSKEQQRDKMKEIMTAQHAKIKSLLTPAPQQTFEQMKKDRKTTMRKGPVCKDCKSTCKGKECPKGKPECTGSTCPDGKPAAAPKASPKP